jgi:riboflavin synthase
MFTGIIRATAEVRGVEERRGTRAVAIVAPKGWKLPAGGSVAVDGICSTVTSKRNNIFFVDYMPETLRVTTAADFESGRIVNLELPLCAGDTLDGNFVQGHVDGVATVVRVSEKGASREIAFRIPKKLQKFVVHKGSITINGVALTVAGVKGSQCTVALIPYTNSHTNLGTLLKGDGVNIEIDLVARYLARLRAR